MKSKIILNKLTYSLIEKKIKNASYHKVDSNMILEIRKKEEIENNLINIANFSDKKNFYITKIPLGLSNQNNHIKNMYKNQLIGPMILQFYKNQTVFAENVTIKKNKNQITWFIQMENFYIEMPQQNYFKWQYKKENQKSILKTETLISLYMLPLSQFITYSWEKRI